MKRIKFTLMLLFVLIVGMVTGNVYAQDNDGYIIGIVGYFDLTSFTSEMTELGYVEGENVTFMFPFIEGWEEMPQDEFFAAYQLAYEAIASSPDVDIFMTNTDTDAVNLLPLLANPNTPVVFARSDDPVATGAVADLIAPGGNVTGQITNRPHERRLQILTEIKPDTDRIYYLYSILTGEAEVVLSQVEAVGEELGVEVIPAPITDVPSALTLLEPDNVPEGIDWLFMTPYVPFDFAVFGSLASISLEFQAGIAGVISSPIQTYVMGYGPDLAAGDREAARMIDRILRGANPAEMPVQVIENTLSINLEAAAAIGLEIPEGILRQADIIARPGDFDEIGMYIGNG